MKSEGVSAHQRRTTESGNLGCTRSKSQERKTEEDGKKSDGEKMRKTEEEEANIGNEENLRRWKTNLDTACQGEQLLSGGFLDDFSFHIGYLDEGAVAKGRGQWKKTFSFGHCPNNGGGGSTHSRIFWPSF